MRVKLSVRLPWERNAQCCLGSKYEGDALAKGTRGDRRRRWGWSSQGQSMCAACTAWIDGLVRQYIAAKDWSEIKRVDEATAFGHLPDDQVALISMIFIGQNAWCDGFKKASVQSARHQAAMGLLILEKNHAPLTAESVQQITKSPSLVNPSFSTL